MLYVLSLVSCDGGILMVLGVPLDAAYQMRVMLTKDVGIQIMLLLWL